MASNSPYDNVASERLKVLSAGLLRVIKTLTGKQDMDAHGAAVAVMIQALGFESSGSGPNQVTDQQVRAAISRTDGMLRLINAYAWTSRRIQRRHRKL